MKKDLLLGALTGVIIVVVGLILLVAWDQWRIGYEAKRDGEIDSKNYHVYPFSEESIHHLRDGSCPCTPEKKYEATDNTIVWVHKELKA